MDSLEYFRFMLQRRIEAGEISPKETLDAIHQLVSYAGHVNEHDAKDGLQTREEREQAYMVREERLSGCEECRKLSRWHDKTSRARLRER
jgi:hypothetical protein